MAELLYADAHIAGDFPAPGNAIGNTPNSWAGSLNTNSNYTSRWSMQNPVNPLTPGATQSISIVARKGSNSNNPAITINIYENGVEVSGLGTMVTVTSTVGQVVTKTFNSNIISNGANVEVEVVQSGQGGSGSARNSAQISHIEWVADTSAPSAPTVAPTLTVTGVTHGSVSLEAGEVSGATSYEFQRSVLTIQDNSSRTVTDSGLSPETTYQYRVRARNASGDGPWSAYVEATTTVEPVFVTEDWTTYPLGTFLQGGPWTSLYGIDANTSRIVDVGGGERVWRYGDGIAYTGMRFAHNVGGVPGDVDVTYEVTPTSYGGETWTAPAFFTWRNTEGQETRYFCKLTSGSVDIFRLVNNTFTALLQTPRVNATGVRYKVRVRHIGSQLTVWLNDAEILNVTENVLTTGPCDFRCDMGQADVHYVQTIGTPDPGDPGLGTSFQWKGFTWESRIWGGDPQYNGLWSRSAESIYLDAQDRLHLAVKRINGELHGAEVKTAGGAVGYGYYTFVSHTNPMDIPNTSVLGMFTYDDYVWNGGDPAIDSPREIDFELATWNVASNPMRWLHTYHPMVGDERGLGAYDRSAQTRTAHVMKFEPGRIQWWTYDQDGQLIGYDETTQDVFDAGTNLAIHLNHWVNTYGGQVIDASTPESEMVIAEVKYETLAERSVEPIVTFNYDTLGPGDATEERSAPVSFENTASVEVAYSKEEFSEERSASVVFNNTASVSVASTSTESASASVAFNNTSEIVVSSTSAEVSSASVAFNNTVASDVSYIATEGVSSSVAFEHTSSIDVSTSSTESTSVSIEFNSTNAISLLYSSGYSLYAQVEFNHQAAIEVTATSSVALPIEFSATPVVQVDATATEIVQAAVSFDNTSGVEVAYGLTESVDVGVTFNATAAISLNYSVAEGSEKVISFNNTQSVELSYETYEEAEASIAFNATASIDIDTASSESVGASLSFNNTVDSSVVVSKQVAVTAAFDVYQSADLLYAAGDDVYASIHFDHTMRAEVDGTKDVGYSIEYAAVTSTEVDYSTVESVGTSIVFDNTASIDMSASKNFTTTLSFNHRLEFKVFIESNLPSLVVRSIGPASVTVYAINSAATSVFTTTLANAAVYTFGIGQARLYSYTNAQQERMDFG